MTRRRLVGLALLVALLAGGFGAAGAAGWAPQGPPPLPLATSTPPAGDPRDHAGPLAREDLAIDGSGFVVELLGPAEVRGGGAYFLARVARTAEGGGSVWPASFVLRDGNGDVLARTHLAEPARDGATLVVSTDLAPGERALAAEVVLRTYREAAWGAWRGDDVVVRLEATVHVAPAD